MGMRNKKRKTGFRKKVCDVLCDTSIDKLMETFERNSNRIVYVYKLSEMFCYMHIVDNGEEEIILFETNDYREMCNNLWCWSCADEPVHSFVNFMVEDGKIDGSYWM
jgi:hypothetical protein